MIGEAHGADTTDNKGTFDDVWTFNRNTLDGAGRNERGIFVRGFGCWQVPLSIDGIRI